MTQITFSYSHSREKEIFAYLTKKFPQEDWAKYDISQPLSQSEINEKIALITPEWEKREKTYIKKLNTFFGSKFSLTGITAYFSRLPRYPYELDWFAIPASNIKQQLYLIVHESMHLAFHKNWEKYCLKLFESTKNPAVLSYSLKEALSELTNTLMFREFKGEGVTDKGKNDSGEQLLRLQLRKFYQQKGEFTFEEFVDEYLK